MSKIRNRRTPEGAELGKNIVRLLEPEIARLALEAGLQDKRCSTCAYRLGSLANGSPQTQMDALKCAIEGVPFYCHERSAGVRGDDELCWGHVVSRMVTQCPISGAKAPWPFIGGYKEASPSSDKASA